MAFSILLVHSWIWRMGGINYGLSQPLYTNEPEETVSVYNIMQLWCKNCLNIEKLTTQEVIRWLESDTQWMLWNSEWQ